LGVPIEKTLGVVRDDDDKVMFDFSKAQLSENIKGALYKMTALDPEKRPDSLSKIIKIFIDELATLKAENKENSENTGDIRSNHSPHKQKKPQGFTPFSLL
jgi:hypothetical protein